MWVDLKRVGPYLSWDLKTGHVRISNGRHMLGSQMVRFLYGKDGLFGIHGCNFGQRLV